MGRASVGFAHSTESKTHSRTAPRAPVFFCGADRTVKRLNAKLMISVGAPSTLFVSIMWAGHAHLLHGELQHGLGLGRLEVAARLVDPDDHLAGLGVDPQHAGDGGGGRIGPAHDDEVRQGAGRGGTAGLGVLMAPAEIARDFHSRLAVFELARQFALDGAAGVLDHHHEVAAARRAQCEIEHAQPVVGIGYAVGSHGHVLLLVCV
jgi:hypothetical protein